MTTAILWQPSGVTLEQTDTKRHVENADGDTPKISLSIRMLSMDTPEKSGVTGGLSHAEIRLLWPQLTTWFKSEDSPVPQALAEHLAHRLDRENAWDAHWKQGDRATEELDNAMETRLEGGRDLFLRIADEHFDSYGRLLAYVAPSFTWEERRAMTLYDRRTFNFQMVELGWAATFMIYPSIPNERDLPMLQEAARVAVAEKRGAWDDPDVLLAYEYRMILKLMKLMQAQQNDENISRSDWTGWVERYCADISTGLLYPPQHYFKVDPWNRLFIWRDDVRDAVAKLNLRPAPDMSGV